MVLAAALGTRSNPGDGLQVGYSQRVQLEGVSEAWKGELSMVTERARRGSGHFNSLLQLNSIFHSSI